ncbi:hypothetical protein AYO21_07761 [Fonsecaea monophora]|uniref:Major facilitator superfamily (MFS) profile domain-containing protein n=1 Tax=Fonsecaea monophora TaxID=254056 RepID=A0A177F494_9EURO|nr:hypothetical protein AYO21_07761 [Fonsecaea monophora]KAH0828528.1 major facilitator superfamily protein [Fonsecaea pedrosoi]OAG38039.1 hypothetical protein AYO21_07761 [Fonsecaea monophora]
MAKSNNSHITPYNRWVIILTGFGSITYGYCSSVISSTIGQPGWYSYFDLPTQGEPGYGGKTTSTIATANGLYSAGGAIGTLLVMWTASALGRRASIQLGAFTALVGGVLQGGAAAIAMFQVGRIVAGIGVGVLVTIVPMFISELSPPGSRGWLVGHHAIFLVWGYLLASWVGYACYFATAHNEASAWRFPLCLQCLPPLVLLVGSPWLPHSPRWLISLDRHEEAFQIIRRLRTTKDDPNEIAAKEEFYQIREQVRVDNAKLKSSGQPVWKLVWTKKSYRKRMIVGFLTQWGSEFSGPLVINNYSVILYTSLGMEGSMPLLLYALWSCTSSLIYNPFGAWLHDKVNSRRGMLMFGTAGCLVTTACLAAMIAEYAGTDNRAGNAAGIFFVFFYLTFEGTFCDTTMYIYVAEIFPTEIRPIGMGFSLFGQFASTIILLQTAPIGFDRVGWKYYLVVIIWCAVFIPIIYFYFPETARLSLEEIGQKFGDEVAVHVNDTTEEKRQKLDEFLANTDIVHLGQGEGEKRADVVEVRQEGSKAAEV